MHQAKRVAKNTGILYGRMLVTVFISLYTTRLVLNALGAADFGLFNLVAGLIAMLGFLNASMAGATQRFISYAQGANDLKNVKSIFNVSIVLHLIIVVLVIIFLEITGYIFFKSVLNILPARLETAKLIYQFMVISTFFAIISVPYEAVITSFENMTFYAFLGIFESVCKLAIAYFITFSSIDHLYLYGLLIAILSFFLYLIRIIYCHKNYECCVINFKKYFDIHSFKKMTNFASWSLLSSAGSILSNYGQGIIINLFFGTIVNAAQAVANQVSGQLSVLSTSVLKAINPVIGKSEGAGNRELLMKATILGSKVSFFLLMVVHIPFLIFMPLLLNIWLKNIPEYAIVFCRLLLIRNLIEQLFIPVVPSIYAQGNIKGYQIASSAIMFLPLIISYLFFKFGYPPQTLYVIYIFYSIFASIIILYFANKNLNLSIKSFLNNVVFRCIISFIIVFIAVLVPYSLIGDEIIRLVSSVVINVIVFLFVAYYVGLSVNEKEIFTKLFNSIFQKYLK